MVLSAVPTAVPRMNTSSCEGSLEGPGACARGAVPASRAKRQAAVTRASIDGPERKSMESSIADGVQTAEGWPA